ncbi:MAG: SBBP repeat-containing protein, partial [Candidatus Zixiibacteriota bacterium]
MFVPCYLKPALVFVVAGCLIAGPGTGIAEVSASLDLTYLGGSSSELAFPRMAVAVGQDGSIYIAGYTFSQDFVSSASTSHGDQAGGEEAFVARLTGDLSDLLGLAVLTGSGSDRATSVAVDGMGRVYIGGHTSSSGFPYTSGAYDSTYNGTGSSPYGDGDVFVARFDSELTELQKCTFLGGAGADYSHCLTLDVA